MTTDTYITKLGTKFRFGFELRKNLEANNYVIVILDQPSYGGRDDNLHVTHRHLDGDDYRVCWTGPMSTLNEAKKVAGFWADFTERYILTGKEFPT